MISFWLFEYLTGFMDSFLCCIFCSTFLTNDPLINQIRPILLTSGAGAAIMIPLDQIDLISFFHTFLIVLLYVILQFLLYRKALWLTVTVTSIYSVISTAVDFSAAYFTLPFLGTYTDDLLHTQSVVRIACMLFSKLILVMIVLIVRRIYRDAILLIKKYAIVMGLYSILLLSMLFSMAEFSAKGGQAEWEPALTLFFTASIVIELLTFYFVIKAGESFEEKQKTDFMKLQNRMLRKSLNETEQTFQLWKKSIHDHKNTTIALLQLAEDEKLDELKKYLKQETYLIDRKMFYIKTGNSVVDAIINTKQNIAESKGISFIVNASLPEFCTIRDLDLAHILGNLLDNAMEASAGENEPCIDITIRQEKMFLIIKIVNSYSRKLPKNLRTAKKNSLFHGLGLESVKDIVKKYHGDFSIKQNNSQVIVQLLLLNRPA